MSKTLGNGALTNEIRELCSIQNRQPIQRRRESYQHGNRIEDDGWMNKRRIPPRGKPRGRIKEFSKRRLSSNTSKRENEKEKTQVVNV